jgi:Cupin domain
MLQTGTAHVWLDTQERDAHAGAVVFIPAGTWVGLKNVGTESVGLVFVFSDPGFDDCLRCTSTRHGEPSSIVTPEELNECQQQGRLEFAK